MSTINLNECVKGQKLRSKHGLILEYVASTIDPQFQNDWGKQCYDHVVKYPNGSLGTRMNDGFVFKNLKSRLECDHDIVEILPLTYKKTQEDIRQDNKWFEYIQEL